MDPKSISTTNNANNLNSILGIGNILTNFLPRNDLVTQEIFNIIKTISNKNNKNNKCRNWVISVITGVFKVILFLSINHYITNYNDLLSLLKQFCWYIMRIALYKQRVYAIKKAGIESIISRELSKLPNDGEIIRGIPMYITKTDSEINVLYANNIHTSYLNNLTKLAATELDESTRCSTKIYLWSDGGKYVLEAVSNMYPSNNFVNMENIVDKFMLASTLLGSNKVAAIKINGIPGLGKSAFPHYLAIKNKVNNIYRVDMTNNICLKSNPTTLFDVCYHKIIINGPTIFMFDEIDKWLDYQIKQGYEMYIIHYEKQQLANNNINNNNNNVTNKVSLDQFSNSFRTKFLYNLLAVLERSGNEYPSMVIFCCNNFDSIFGDLDLTHFESLKDRFQTLTFNTCKREEVISYLKYNNSKFIGSDLYNPNLDNIVTKLNECDITYRKLIEISNMSAYDPEKIIVGLNNYSSNNNNNNNNHHNNNNILMPFINTNFNTYTPIDVEKLRNMKAENAQNTFSTMRGYSTCSQLCKCGISFALRCECISCESHYNSSDKTTVLCHWCITDEVYPINRMISITDIDAKAEIKKLQFDYSSGVIPYPTLIEYINKDEIVMAVRTSTDTWCVSYPPLVRECIGSKCFLENNVFYDYAELYNTTLIKWTMPL
jgi:hypothetical protein